MSRYASHSLHLLATRLEPLFPISTAYNVTRKSKMFSFSSEEGKDLVHQILKGRWPHTPRNYQIEAVAKALDGIDVLAILPTGAGKTAILAMAMLILIHIKLNPEDFALCCGQFPDDPIMIIIYPTNCLEEEQVGPSSKAY